jgi:2,3-bisphosphoglycerate-independent phosphoglycerate mutase
VPALLAILDGLGWREPAADNAVTSADAPFLKELLADARYPCRSLRASGRDVGLPEGQMGNSEVGHLNIGSGRIVYQELTRIDEAIEDGSFAKNPVLLQSFKKARDNGATVHLMGLLSDGGVHSMQSHLEALLALAASSGCRRVRVHAFLDGRDVSPESGAGYLERLERFCTGLVAEHMGLDLRVSTICGRYFAMDRDRRWQRVERAWRAMVVPFEPDVRSVVAQSRPAELVRESYAEQTTDEFVEPLAIGSGAVVSGDTLVFFNFRPDRARELTRAFCDPHFDDYGFARPVAPELDFVTLTEYDPAFAAFGVQVAFAKEFPENTLADYLAARGLRQLHIAETEKYAHVTFFLNGGIEAAKPGEQRVLINSPQVATYDLQPQMSAPEVTAALLEAIRAGAADVYIVNFANGDMVGHTGVFNAAVKAVEAVDRCLKQVVEAVLEKGGAALITADHGNCEQMRDAQGRPWTAHTTSPVPLALVAADNANRQLDLCRDGEARLADVAPTLVDLLGLPKPEQWSGRSLLVRG